MAATKKHIRSKKSPVATGANISLDFIKRYTQFNNKTVLVSEVKQFIDDLQAAAKAGHFKNTDPLIKYIREIQTKIVKVYNENVNEKKIKFFIKNAVDITCELQGLGFLPMMISAGVAKMVEHVTHNLLKKKDKPVEALNGLSEAGFVRADQSASVKSPGTYKLPGEIGKLLQDIQPFKYSIILTGDPHAGKTEFVMQLANSFADAGKEVGMFMLEQGGLESKDTKEAKDRNITPENQKRVQVTGEAKNGIDTLKQLATEFNVIIVDSWQKLNVPATQFDSLRHEFPNTIWVVIFQQNGEGKTRGGVSADYDSPVHLIVHKVDPTFTKNYVEVKKNRGNPATLNLKYMIKAKKTVSLTEKNN